ncbi:MAG TPA: ParA family protein, partial [Bacteroidales bacterium]|nr:ParA family protein [Bacteroidales bacterium]
MSNIISIINNKGGTGKTTTVLNLGAALAKKKQRVLMVDLDSQCNLSSAFGANGTEQGIGELLVGKVDINSVIIPNGKLSLIPANE